jgi:eukaryotic-like serine/threonine-protein kinase
MVRTLAGDRYRLERRLGRGGMASVYLARDTKLGRPVAVKLLAEGFADDDEARRRFEREARLAARLHHPNVVQIFDVGEEEAEGRPFIVMEHVEGGTLADLIARRTRRPARRRAVALLAQACEGLGHAHRNGLVHRDVKPQNLLIRRGDGQVKVADFGIARALEESAITRTGHVVGTKPYMAPEQLDGSEISPATDVYALGVVGRELLGERAPPKLDAVLRRCLSEDPRNRFADATELREALERGDPDAGATEATTIPVAGDGEATTPALGWTAPTAPRRPTVPGWRLNLRRFGHPAAILGAGAVLVAAAALIASFGDGDSNTDRPVGEPSPSVPAGEPAPRLQDPAEQGRALADWLRRRSR